MIDNSQKNNMMRNLPSVDQLLKLPFVLESIDSYGHDRTVEILRIVLDELREKIILGKINDIDSMNIDNISSNFFEKQRIDNNKNLKKTINATGVILHTNLGRAPISKEVTRKALETIENYSNLEFDLESGKRGSRDNYLKKLLCKLTGAEDAVVVNNNAAAVMLILSTLAKNKEVIVSRGELVEIGGSFRVPDVMAQSGSLLVEVGTTNKTHKFDYESAITENTALIMKIHTSNYKILGFTETLQIKDMKIIGDKYDLPVVEDIGSGVLIDLRQFGLPYEPTVQDSIKQGADIVSFSGDKLLGGPQAGIIVGKKKYIQQIKKNQLLRALRIDKVIISLLYHTLKLYEDDDIYKKIPIINMMSTSLFEVQKRAEILFNKILEDKNLINLAIIELIETKAQVGGGSLPNEYIDSFGISIKPHNMSTSKLEELLRKSENHIITRIQNDALIIDVRTIFDNDIEIISNIVKQILS